jgi:asparagine synthase (glutamine-hydrolysing)
VRWHNTSQVKNFFHPGVLPPAEDLDSFVARVGAALPAGFDGWNPLGKAQYLESTLFLANYLLATQGDRMAMANSVEGRYPFLDYRVVELAARMPSDLRLHGLTEKYILKHIARGQVPQELIDRPKQPYRAPIGHCFFGPKAPEYVAELLGEAALKRAGYFDHRRVERLVAKSREQAGAVVSERENMALAAILSTQLLDHQFIQEFPDFSDAPLAHTVCELQAAS